MLAAGRVQAWVVGPGLGTDDAAAEVVRAVLSTDVPVLVDADGLTIVAKHPEWLHERAERGAVTLLTPHEGEFARLVGGDPDEVKKSLAADRLGATRRAAAELRATVLLKGSTTLVADPDGRARVNAHRHRLAGHRRAAATCSPALRAPCWRPDSARSMPAASAPTCMACAAQTRGRARRATPALHWTCLSALHEAWAQTLGAGRS